MRAHSCDRFVTKGFRVAVLGRRGVTGEGGHASR
jgi:hypothetical protein